MIGRRAARALGAILLASAVAWAALALLYAGPGAEALRLGLSGALCLLAILFLVLLPPRWAMLAVGAATAAVLAWWLRLEPSNDRVWEPEVAVAADAQVAGDRVMVRNIRNFGYRTETDFTPRYYDAEYELGQLASLDLVVSHWSSEAIAHVFVTFGFSDGRHLAFSVEVRRERGEAFSEIAGFFRRYELVYVVADERDLIGLRTDIRREEVYLYRIQAPAEARRRLFLSYVSRVHALAERPEFYNTLTSNCTTNVLAHASSVAPGILYNWKVLVSGYADRYAYDLGRLDTRLPFDALKRSSRIRRDTGDTIGEDFSRRIRQGLPLAEGP